MLKDFKASKMFTMLRNGCAVAEIARRLTVSEKTIRTYRDRDLLPSQVERAPRTHRTRVDPLEAIWLEIEALLKSDPQLKPITVLGWLQQKHNLPESDPSEQVVPDSLRRTLERRIHKWKIQYDVQQEVVLPQVHLPGDVIAFDFVVLNMLGVTLNGQQFDHKLFHATLTYSNWQHIHLCYSESFQALSTGLQDALHLIGGVPRRVRSDSLSAAVNNLSSDKEFAKQYQGLLNHYGLTFGQLRKVKPMRQIEMAELMCASSNFSVSYAKCLLAATQAEQLLDKESSREIDGLSPIEISRMEREMDLLTKDFKQIEETHGKNVLNLVIVVGYLKRLIDNARVVRYLVQSYPEIMAEFQKVVESRRLDDNPSE